MRLDEKRTYMVNYISVAEFQEAHPEIDVSQYTPATISGFISQASEHIDNFCNVDGFDFKAVVSEQSQSLIKKNGDLLIFTRRFPIVDVSEIKLRRAASTLTLTLSQGSQVYWEKTSDARNIAYINQILSGTGNFVIRDLSELRNMDFYTIISYTAGYQTIPNVIKRACMLLVRDILSKRLNVAGASSITQGGISIKYSERDGKSDDMIDAESLLQEYVRVVTI